MKRILVVDDEPTILAAVATRLRAEDFSIDTAIDGPSAVATAAATTPDLVVLDVMLPGFDGLEVCRRIQAVRSTPVLMLTARSDETDMLIGLGIGADDYLTKPFSMRELVARVRVLLRLPCQPAAHCGHPRHPARIRVGLGIRCGEPHRGQPRQGFATQAGTRTDPDRARRRLCAGNSAMSGFAAWRDGRLAAVRDRLPRPLDPFASFKVKMGLLVASAITLASFTFWIGASWQFRYALLAALVTSLALTQFLAHGMTSPLRQMTNAAGAMARGDYSRRVRATSRDEIGQLATAFNQMAADLGAADEYRRGLIGNVSHELNTPIAALHALLENVVDGVAEPDPETMRIALSQTARLGELVTNLLDLSRVEGGAIPLQLRPFRVDEFLHEAIEHVAVSPGHVEITVEVSPPDLVAVADPARLRQVVVNLVDNAIRHSPAGSRVSVVASAAVPAGVRLDVCDEGPGIPPAERERVFQRFSRGATSAGGTGLGLAIARWAVELHGGTVEVMDVRTGCRIRVTIPDLATMEELA